MMFQTLDEFEKSCRKKTKTHKKYTKEQFEAGMQIDVSAFMIMPWRFMYSRKSLIRISSDTQTRQFNQMHLAKLHPLFLPSGSWI